MKANELRIGNLVKYPGRPNYECWPIADYHFRQIIDGNCCVVGVPLTEDWFRKLSEEEFEFIGFGTMLIWQHKIYESIKYEFITDGSCDVYFNDEIINRKLYVHEWQNIHHALTGQELKIK